MSRSLRPPRPTQPRPKFRGYCVIKPDLAQAPEHLWRRLYIRTVEEGLEGFHGYRPGGYHPIHLGDELHEGQYSVLHKLGYGGYSTVWLCRDQSAVAPTYVAVKILMASETGKDCRELFSFDLKHKGIDETAGGQYLCLPLKQFKSKSPNGTHICLVYPVLGPSVRSTGHFFADEGDDSSNFRKVFRQTVDALATLHSHSICHGDFRPSNMLLGLKSLDGLDEEDVISLLGEQETTDVHVRQDSHPSPEVPYAPKYLVYPVDFEGDVEHSLVRPHIQIIDFGRSFETKVQARHAEFGIPVNYAAPEIILDNLGGIGIDLWSLGCTLFEMRLGRRLFDVFQLVRLAKKHYVVEIASLLGPPPEQWSKHYAEPKETEALAPMMELFRANQELSKLQRRRLIREKILRGPDPEGRDIDTIETLPMSESEAEILADLLERLLRYREEDRLAAQDIVKHAWFDLPT